MQRKEKKLKEFYFLFNTMPLFSNISTEHYVNVFRCLQAKIKEYEKGEIISGIYDKTEDAGIVLSGKVNIIFFSKYGVEHNVHHFEQGSLFGEAFACVPQENSTLEIIASEKSKILFLRFSKLFTEKARNCPYASQVTLNLLRETARKNIFLNKKVEILAQKKVRDKIGIYFKMLQNSGSTINVPINRQEMANFLGVDRSALSRELSAMRDEGIIEFKKNNFVVLNSKWL